MPSLAGRGIPGEYAACVDSKGCFMIALCSVHVCMLSRFSCVWQFVTLWTIAHQAPLSAGISRQEYWSGALCLLQGILLMQGSNACLLHLLQWQVSSLPLVPPRKPPWLFYDLVNLGKEVLWVFFKKIFDKRTMFMAQIISAINDGISFQLVFCPNIPMGCNTLISVIVCGSLLHWFIATWTPCLSKLRVGWWGLCRNLEKSPFSDDSAMGGGRGRENSIPTK